MQNWNPSVVFEVGYGQHLERIAKGEKSARQTTDSHERQLRTSLAAAIVGLAGRLSRSA